YIDAFGNVQLGATAADLEALGVVLGQSVALGVEFAAVERPGGASAAGAGVRRAAAGGAPAAAARYVRTFADAHGEELILYVDSAGAVALAVNLGSAAARLGLRANDLVRISASVG